MTDKEERIILQTKLWSLYKNLGGLAQDAFIMKN